mmetsp:Transcript_115515/g.331559  ORF Transcript_115515/g.331559 Transcript_115515/m.331559 type:complete len:106 (+) Transcript_115515:802-1119(+)
MTRRCDLLSDWRFCTAFFLASRHRLLRAKPRSGATTHVSGLTPLLALVHGLPDRCFAKQRLSCVFLATCPTPGKAAHPVQLAVEWCPPLPILLTASRWLISRLMW